NPSHSFGPEGWEPSPTMNASTKATLATLQTLAVHRRAGTHLCGLSIGPSIVCLPGIKEDLPAPITTPQWKFSVNPGVKLTDNCVHVSTCTSSILNLVKRLFQVHPMRAVQNQGKNE